MKKISALAALLISGGLSAATLPTPPNFAPVGWDLRVPNQSIVVENQTNRTISVFIAVKNDEFSHALNGINIQNCSGTFKQVNAGSSVICSINAGAAPLNFTMNNVKPGSFSAGVYEVQL